MKKRYTEAQIIGYVKEAESGIPVKELCRKYGFSDASFYTWRSKYGGIDISDAKKLKELEHENARLKKLLAETMLDKEASTVVLIFPLQKDQIDIVHSYRYHNNTVGIFNVYT